MLKSNAYKRDNGELKHVLRIGSETHGHIDYAVKLHRGKWYVYLSRFDDKYIRRHGPFTLKSQAENCIYSIRDELANAIAKAKAKADASKASTQITPA